MFLLQLYRKKVVYGSLWVFGVVSVLLFLIPVTSAHAAANSAEVVLSNRKILTCGPNALYMFTLLCGYDAITLEQFKGIPVFEDGSSLADMRDAARKAGINTIVKRYEMKDIGILPLPAIAQFKASGSSLTPWHFNVVYRVDSQLVYTLDGTTGRRFNFAREKLSESWEGFALTRQETFSPFRSPRTTGALVALFLPLFLLLLGRKIWERVTKLKQVTVSVALLMLSIFVTFPATTCSAQPTVSIDSAPFWRASRNSGINVLYCYLGLTGAPCRYSDLETSLNASGEFQSISELAATSRKAGINLVPAHFSLSDLEKSDLPLIVHLDGDTPEAGRFILLLTASKQKINYIEGATGSILSMTYNDFKRIWSGYALVNPPSRIINLAAISVGCLFGILLPVALGRLKIRLYKRTP